MGHGKRGDHSFSVHSSMNIKMYVEEEIEVKKLVRKDKEREY